MRPQRRRGVTMPSTTASHERPREEWIGIPVPAVITEESFARAQELLQENKIRSRRRTIAPSVVQGLVSCAKCGYAFSRTSTQTSARKIHYYKCIGSDSWRKLGGPVCDNGRFVRQELLDQIVWAEVIRLLEEPVLIQQELDRRLAAARSSDPTRKREQSLQRDLTQVGKGIERLLNAYQEGLLSIEQLRERMPGLRQREQTIRAELQAIDDQLNDRAAFLRLAETLTAFLGRLRTAAETISITERQRIVRLLVKDVLVGEDTITIRHSIPIPSDPPRNGGSQSPDGQDYLLCKGRAVATAVKHPADRSGPRTGEARASLLPLRRRLQRVCRKPAEWTAGDEGDHGVSGAKTETESQCGQERGGAAVAAEVPGLQHDVAQETEAEDRATEPRAVCGKDPQDATGRPWTKSETNHRAT